MYSPDQGQTTKSFLRKLYCSEHGNKFTFKCGYSHCQRPFVCTAPTCIEEHFHHQNEGKLVLFKFDATDCVKKFQQLDRVLNTQDFSGEAKILKTFIDELKVSMVTIYKDYRELHLRKQSLAVDLARPFDNVVMTKVEETINIGQNLRKQIELVKSKINLNMTQNIISPNQKDDISIRSENGSSKSSKINMIQLQSQGGKQVHNKKGQRQYEQGQVVMQKAQKNPQVEPIQIDLEISNNKQIHKTVSASREEISPPQNQSIYIPPFQRPQTKDSFEQLFENASKTYSADQVSNFRNFLQNSKKKNENNQNEKSSAEQISPSKSKPSIFPLKQHLKIYERDFLMKKQLTIFLEQKIKNFSWGLCQQIYSSAMPFKSIQKFHEALQGRRNLVFIFIGDDRILGSYYPSRYPRLAQKTRNDPNSFLFISNPINSTDSQIIGFKAVPNQFHLSVSERLYICHGNQPSYADGIRTIQKNFKQLNFCLPSVSFKYETSEYEKAQSKGNQQMQKKGLSGFLKVKQFFVLQVSPIEQENVYQID